MKSSEVVPMSRRRHRHVPDDIITCEIFTLAAIELSPVAIVLDTTPVGELASLFVETRAPVLLAVDGERTLLGVVTRTDVLRELAVEGATAASVMSGFVLALTTDSTVECAAALMAAEGVGQVIVIGDAGELVGVVTSLDIARHVAVRAGYLPR